MCTDEFPVARSRHAPPGGGEGGCAGSGAAGFGDACTAFVDPHPDLVLMLARLDDLEVDVRNLPAECQQVDDRHVVDADHAVRVAEAEVDHRTVGVATELVPALGTSIGSTEPMSTLALIVSGSSVTASVTTRSPASVRIRCGARSPRRAASACAKHRMPLPLISARLPSALYSVIRAA